MNSFGDDWIAFGINTWLLKTCFCNFSYPFFSSLSRRFVVGRTTRFLLRNSFVEKLFKNFCICYLPSVFSSNCINSESVVALARQKFSSARRSSSCGRKLASSRSFSDDAVEFVDFLTMLLSVSLDDFHCFKYFLT